MTSKLKAFLLFVLLIPCWVIAAQYEIDLVNLYNVTEFARIDLSKVYAYNGSLGRFFYGPVTLLLLWPLSFVPFVVAKWIWIVLQTISYAIFWYFLYQLYPVLRDKKVFWGWLVVFILSINPIHNNYQSNNVQLMIMAALVAAEVWSSGKSEWLQLVAGMLVALVAAIKVFPLFIVVYYILTRGPRVREGIWAGFFFCIASTVLFFGLHETALLHKDFLMGLTTYEADNPLTKSPDILCLPSLLSRWLPPATATIATQTLIVVISSLFFGWAWWTERNYTDARLKTHIWAMACCLMAFLNPSTRPHYFIFYIPAAVSVLEVIYESQSRKLLTAFLILATLLIAFTVEGVVGKQLNNQMEAMSLPTIGFILLTISLVIALKRRLAMPTMTSNTV